MHLAELPDKRAGENPEAPALSDEFLGTVNNCEFLNSVVISAARLASAGVVAGDVVGIQLPNRAEFVVAMFAAWRVGATVTPIIPWLTEDELSHQIDDADAILVVREDEALYAPTHVRIVTLSELSSLPFDIKFQERRPSQEDVALIIYTSGSTGQPKGVELTHDNITSMATSLVQVLALSASDHSLLVLPLFHVNGIIVSVLAPLLAGGQTTMIGRFSSSTFFDTVDRVRPSYFSGVPSIFAMLDALPAEIDPDTSSIRFAICGAAPMSVELITRFEERFRLPIVEGYGLSEATCASTINPFDGKRKAGTVGIPLPGQSVAIMDPYGLSLPDGSIGEVVVKGPTVMRGYRNRAEETRQAIKNGWLYTGDIGKIDPEGYLILVDRSKDIIIRGGENIFPKEIESVVYRYPGVAEVAVVGRTHPIYGEVPIAFIVDRPGQTTDPEAILEHTRQSLAKFKIPAAILKVDSLPRNPVGKIDKPRLRSSL